MISCANLLRIKAIIKSVGLEGVTNKKDHGFMFLKVMTTTCMVMSIKRSYVPHSKFYLHIVYLLLLFFINMYVLNNEGIKSYISRYQSTIDILLIHFVTTLIFVYININESIKTFIEATEKGGQDRFISFMYITDLNYISYIVLGIVICLSGIRLLTCLKFGKRFYSFYYSYLICRLSLLWTTILLLMFIYSYVYMLKCIFKVPDVYYTVSLHTINVQSSYQEIRYLFTVFLTTMKLVCCLYTVAIMYYYRKSKFCKLSMRKPINLFTFAASALKPKARKILQLNVIMRIRRLFWKEL